MTDPRTDRTDETQESPAGAEIGTIDGPSWQELDRWTPIAGAVLCAVVMWVYLTTMGTTVPFWDAGEFIATSKILGIPHPPGTPLYVLLGRIACLIPFGPIAARVNALSAVASTIAVLFTFLATIKLLRSMWSREPAARWYLALGAGLLAGVALAFSETFWTNAIEAEVYGLSSMVMAISIWSVLRWREMPGRERQVGWLLVIFFMLSLSIGLHLGTYLVLPGLAVLVAMEWIQEPARRRQLAIALLVALVGLPLLAMLAATGVIHDPGFTAAMRFLIKWVPILGAITVALVVAYYRPRFAAALVGLFVLGVSVHFYLIIRAGVDPPPSINEADPSNWRALWDVLARKQYPPSDLFERRGPLLFQFDRLYLFYLKDQFQMLPQRLGMVIPLALGFLGAIAQLVWRRRDAAMMLTHFWVMCVLLVIYLNLSGTWDEATQQWMRGEVRERDYFFVPSFQIFAMWIGIGAATLGIEAVRLARGRAARLALAIGCLVALAALAVPMTRAFAHRHAAHDRTDNYIARDYGYNILNFLEPDALLFTNGDNDTFPLWYLQEVEGVRRDVRVICLSLLNTDWYIRQCRDYVPRVPMTLEDDVLANMQVAFDPRTENIFVVDRRVPGTAGILGPGTVKDVAVRNIIETNAFERPIYFAVTVPDRVGQDNLLSFEGMVFRILPEPPARPVNFERTYENVFENFLYRGLLLEDFTRNPQVVVDDTGEYLIQNYVNMFTQLAYELNARDRQVEAMRMVTAARAINPDFVQLDLLEGILLDELGRHDESVAVFQAIIDGGRAQLDAYYRMALVHYHAGQLAQASVAMEAAAGMAGPEFIEPTLWLARFHWDRQQPAVARELIGRWITSRPDDTHARMILERLSQNDDSLLPK